MFLRKKASGFSGQTASEPEIRGDQKLQIVEESPSGKEEKAVVKEAVKTASPATCTFKDSYYLQGPFQKNHQQGSLLPVSDTYPMTIHVADKGSKAGFKVLVGPLARMRAV